MQRRSFPVIDLTGDETVEDLCSSDEAPAISSRKRGRPRKIHAPARGNSQLGTRELQNEPLKQIRDQVGQGVIRGEQTTTSSDSSRLSRPVPDSRLTLEDRTKAKSPAKARSGLASQPQDEASNVALSRALTPTHQTSDPPRKQASESRSQQTDDSGQQIMSTPRSALKSVAVARSSSVNVTSPRHRLGRSRGSEVPNRSASPTEVTVHQSAGSETKREFTWTTNPGLGTSQDVGQLIHEQKEIKDSHQEYLLEARLSQANLQRQKFERYTMQTSDENPFAELRAKAVQPHDSIKPPGSKTLTIEIKAQRGPGLKKFVSTKVVPRELISDESHTLLPKYNSIGRLGFSFLARNVHTLTTQPYLSEHEINEDDATEQEAELSSFYVVRFDKLYEQRVCKEHVWSWMPHFDELLIKFGLKIGDIVRYYIVLIAMDKIKDDGKCPKCSRIRDFSRYDDMIQALRDTGRSWYQEAILNIPGREQWFNAAQTFCSNFRKSIGLPAWHFLNDQQIGNVIRREHRIAKGKQCSAEGRTMCSICHRFHCISHGHIIEEPDVEQIAEIDNEEPYNNHHVEAKVQSTTDDASQPHQCGVFCFGAERLTLPEIYGLQDDGTVNGRYRVSAQSPMDESTANPKPCGEECFLRSNKRPMQAPPIKIDAALSEMFRVCASLWSGNLSSPCIISRLMRNYRANCRTTFYMLLRIHAEVPHPAASNIEIGGSKSALSQTSGSRKEGKMAEGYDTSNSADVVNRYAFVPCSHKGACLVKNGCTCAEAKVHCERFCGCSSDCKRVFPGCKCKGRACAKDDRCECWAHGRECDPWLCQNCGVVEVLDPNNKYREDIRHGRCRNNGAQLGLPARTIVAPSSVQGMGLFAGENLSAGQFIGEYTGEIISGFNSEHYVGSESHRRGVIYHHVRLEYLFNTSGNQELDGADFGNKTRFINNSKEDKHINVEPRTMIINGAHRIKLSAKRAIKAGDELYYDYGYSQSQTKHFQEPGEGPKSKVTATPLAEPKAGEKTGRRIASKTAGEVSPTARRSRTVDSDRNKKRKANVLDEETEGEEEDVEVGSTAQAGLEGDNDHVLTDNNPSAEEDDSEYSGDPWASSSDPPRSAGVSEGDSEGEAATSSRSDNHVKVKQRQRRTLPGDRRKGGLAQRKAWETRKNKAAAAAAAAEEASGVRGTSKGEKATSRN